MSEHAAQDTSDRSRVFKIVSRASWVAAVEAGHYQGSADDRRDGFIHLSTARQVPGTLARHFRGKDDLILVALDAASLGSALKWEPSRGGELFPHLYGPLDVALSEDAWPLLRGGDGLHIVPAEILTC
jgi:uncharacterized protein (DUF952 family)